MSIWQEIADLFYEEQAEEGMNILIEWAVEQPGRTA